VVLVLAPDPVADLVPAVLWSRFGTRRNKANSQHPGRGEYLSVRATGTLQKENFHRLDLC
jgi:hypothetical protein